MCLEHELSHSVDGDVQASQEVTFPLEGTAAKPIGLITNAFPRMQHRRTPLAMGVMYLTQK